ncbi:Chitinase 1 [Pleurotus pulmonarius]|nr:Chitinase 1 [Pleurotus pulmonarius]KAF4596458.1 Chitinase 1 [Pleurotus pulmonarius]KAF4597392.1 Chitinase 1 [Pleurotus pulmonarius]
MYGFIPSVAVGAALSLASSALAFDNSRSDNVAVYYGQNSYGATHSDTANWQKALSTYCQDDSIDAFPLAFLHVFFASGGLPSINMANTCNTNDNAVFPGTELPNCSFMAADIQACQAKGKIITLSLGGATGAASFSSDAQAQQFADTIWNLFLGGSSSTRPFGNAVLDGVDLDIEGGGSTGFAAFINRLRTHTNSASKKYYVTAAPQCPFPDAFLGAVLNAVAFDAVYVQFYNNFCGLTNFNNPNAWNFAQWDTWAKTVSPNRNVKIYIGAPAAPTAAGSGYVDPATLASIAVQTRNQFSSFGGIMLWDASQAFANNRFDRAIKNAIRTSGGGSGTTAPPPPPPTTTPPATTPPATTPQPTTSVGTGSCAGVASWVSNIAYVGGSQVVFNGHLWTAKWWSQADTPGGAAGVWTDNGACSGFAGAHANVSQSPSISHVSSLLSHSVATAAPKAQGKSSDSAAISHVSVLPHSAATPASESQAKPAGPAAVVQTSANADATGSPRSVNSRVFTY